MSHIYQRSLCTIMRNKHGLFWFRRCFLLQLCERCLDPGFDLTGECLADFGGCKEDKTNNNVALMELPRCLSFFFNVCSVHTSSPNDWLWNGTLHLHAVLKWFSGLPWCLFCYGNLWFINITSRSLEQKIMNPGGKEQCSPPSSAN